MALRGVLFDLDGTIVETVYDWEAIRAELETNGVPILGYLETLPEPAQSRKRGILERHEAEATRKGRLKRGIRPLLVFCSDHGLRTALVTNNSAANVRALLDRFLLSFDYVSSRESGLWKPSGAPLRAAMNALRLSPEECCAVGDSPFDVRAAEDAGIRRVFILAGRGTRAVVAGAKVFRSVSALQTEIATLI
jgi:HAD superfamily hydrolase (TIGR01509 family)